MAIIIKGPNRPSKAFEKLEVNLDRAWEYEDIFDIFFVKSISAFFNPLNGYYDHGNKIIYDTIWQKVFQSLTGESFLDCFTQTILRDEDYLGFIEETFGSIAEYIKNIGYHPLEVHGINIDGTWSISRDKKNIALLADEFHEIGHRVYAKSANEYHRELGANYFMLLALQKTNTELQPYGVSIPKIDFGKQITENHGNSLNEAMRLINTKTPYVHKIE